MYNTGKCVLFGQGSIFFIPTKTTTNKFRWTYRRRTYLRYCTILFNHDEIFTGISTLLTGHLKTKTCFDDELPTTYFKTMLCNMFVKRKYILRKKRNNNRKYDTSTYLAGFNEESNSSILVPWDVLLKIRARITIGHIRIHWLFRQGTWHFCLFTDIYRPCKQSYLHRQPDRYHMQRASSAKLKLITARQITKWKGKSRSSWYCVINEIFTREISNRHISAKISIMTS